MGSYGTGGWKIWDSGGEIGEGKMHSADNYSSDSFSGGGMKNHGAVSNLSNLSFFVTIAWKMRLQIVSIKIILYIIIYNNI